MRQAQKHEPAAPGLAVRRGLQRSDALVPYLSVRQLVKRWTRPPYGQGVFTRQSVYRVFRFRDFPAPAVADSEGITKLYSAGDIVRFEEAHPELTDGDAKWKKIRKAGRRALYARRMKGEAPPPDV
jgi:hypothetical protein